MTYSSSSYFKSLFGSWSNKTHEEETHGQHDDWHDRGDDCKDGTKDPGQERDGTVEGTSGNDHIDTSYTGDPEGDMVDAGDALDPAKGDEDLIYGYGGDDTVEAGDADDTVYAGSGDDTVYGGNGDDTIEGGSGNDVLHGDGGSGDGSTTRESFEWDKAPDPDGRGSIDDNDSLRNGFSQDTGSVTVDFSVAFQSSGVRTEFADDEQNIDGIVSDGSDVDARSSLESEAHHKGDKAEYSFDFSEPVQDVSFNVNDIDGDGTVRIVAYGPDGKQVEVNLEGGSKLSLEDSDGVAGADTAHSREGYKPDTAEEYSLTVSIPGPVSSFKVIHSQHGHDDSGVNITDVYYDVGGPDAGVAGNDSIDGGDGDDVIYGHEGDDTLVGGDGSDEIHGGDGDDVIRSGSYGQPDEAYHPYYGADPDPDNDKDTVYGGEGNDHISTGDDDDVIYGGSGDDTIDAGFDDDYVEGGSGNDTIIGNEGNDEIHGGDGDDTISGGLMTDSLDVEDSVDGNTHNNQDVLYGEGGNDTIYGRDDDDTLYGGEGNDYLDGGVDEDTLYGGDGDDTVRGGQGNDTIEGGAGNDTLFGDADRDTFFGGNAGDFVDGGGQGDDYDTLDLTGVEFEDIVYTSEDRENGYVTFSSTQDPNDPSQVLNFGEIENVVPCFTPGTLIATPRGEVRVEELREGDRVITRDNGIQQIRWVGHKAVGAADFRKAPYMKPVLIRAGALGKGLPERDMMVSPNHRVLISNDKTQLYFEEHEVLAAAKHLTGIPGIQSLETLGTTYIHFMFDHHEVVLSDGAWTESFQPGDYTLKGIGAEQRQEIFELFPELASRDGIESYQAARKSLKKHEARLLVS